MVLMKAFIFLAIAPRAGQGTACKWALCTKVPEGKKLLESGFLVSKFLLFCLGPADVGAQCSSLIAWQN